MNKTQHSLRRVLPAALLALLLALALYPAAGRAQDSFDGSLFRLLAQYFWN